MVCPWQVTLLVEGGMLAERRTWHLGLGSECRHWVNAALLMHVDGVTIDSGVGASVCFTKSQSVTSKTSDVLFLTDLAYTSSCSVLTAFLTYILSDGTE